MISEKFQMDWSDIRGQFPLDPNYIQLSLSVITSHPHPVLNSIKYHSRQLNRNPTLHYLKKDIFYDNLLNKASGYLGTSKDLIAITESTTAGLSIIYMGFQLTKDDEVITTTHDHYATDRILYFKCKQSSATLKKISLYQNPFKVTKKEIINNILSNISSKTKLIALTWVHSGTGVKLPIKEISDLLIDINRRRPRNKQIVLSVDTLHGFGVEYIDSVEDLGCDFFIAGCHKWLHGPRGTGIVWGNEKAWSCVEPQSASFEKEAFLPWRKKEHEDDYCPKARLCCPGGFPAFEHRWALGEAFDFHLNIGKKNICQKIKDLSEFSKNHIMRNKKVLLYTPMDRELSSGLVCFDILNKDPKEVIDHCLKSKIIIGQTPYRNSCLRIALSMINTEKEILKFIEVLRKI